ncbi:MAG: hypothetical protein ABEJ46_06370, partial [Gemmatimonadota bacterium]
MRSRTTAVAVLVVLVGALVSPRPSPAQDRRGDRLLGLGVGGSLTVPLPGRFELRGGARFAPGVELLTRSLTCPVSGLTSRPDHCAARSEGSFWLGTVDGVYRTEASPGMPEAFLRLGAGVKSYDFSERPTMEGLGGEELSSGECQRRPGVPGTRPQLRGRAHRPHGGPGLRPLHLGGAGPPLGGARRLREH